MRETKFAKAKARLTAAAVAVALGAGGAVVASSPASAVQGIVDLPTAPTSSSVSCDDSNTAVVGTYAAFNAAYVNPQINCIQLTADISYTAVNSWTGSRTVLDRSLSIDGGGHTLSFANTAAYGNRPFYLKNQLVDNTARTFQLHNIKVLYGYNAYLVSGESDKARGWGIVLDSVNLDGIPGLGTGSPNGRPVSAYLANVFLQGQGSSSNTYGRFYPRNVVVAPGAQWKLKPTDVAPNDPQLDMSFGLKYGPKGASGKVWVFGDLNVDGGYYSAIWEFAGLYVGSGASLTATSHADGVTLGALTTSGTTAGTGQVWVDDNGSLKVENNRGIAIYAVSGAPLDLRTDPGASVVINGYSVPTWNTVYHYSAITLETAGSSLQFNEPALLDIKNMGNTAANNWAIGSRNNNAKSYNYSMAIYDTKQLSTWNHSTPYAAHPDKVYRDATLLTDSYGLALSGTSPTSLATNWDTNQYRRIFTADHEVYDKTVVAPVAVTAPAAGSTSTNPRPVFSGTGEPGATIVVKDQNGTTIGTTTVDSDGKWSVTPTSDLPNGAVNATISQTTPSGTTSTNVSFTQNVPSVVPVTVTAPAIDEVVATSTPTFSGTGTPGATIQVKGSSGKVIAQTTVKTDGTWSVPSSLVLADGAYVATAVQTVGSSVTQAPIRYSIRTQTQQITPVAVTSPALDAVVGDAMPIFTGTGTPGATIQVKGSTGRVIAETTVAPDGTWNAPSMVTLAEGAYIATAVQTAGTNVTQAPIRYTIVLAAPVTITSPAQQGFASDPYPTFSGKGEPGATIQVKGNSGKVIASTTVKADGTWSAQSTVLLIPGHYLGTVTQDAGGTVSNATFDYTNVLALNVLTPATNGTVSGPRPTYTGTGEAGATIQIKGNSGRIVAETTVQGNGTWSAVAQFDLVPGHYMGRAEQLIDSKLINAAAMDYIVG